MIAIGIDPGRDGAVVATDGTEIFGWLLWRQACPDGWVPGLVLDALRGLGLRPDAVALELYAGRGGEGRGSLLTVGVGWGMLAAACAATWPGALLLTPASSSWTRILRDQRGEGKARAQALVSSRLPALDLMPGRRRVPHSGLADAGALALWALERRVG
jgi:hypothetical protein